MIVSRVHKYVCIEIPRTASKAMIEWLRNYNDEWIDGHHRWRVPDEFKDYLVFTVVRNPYDRAMSGFFAECWIQDDPAPPRPKSLAEAIREQNAKRRAEPDGHHMSQWEFVRKGGVSVALYYERLPQCLGELPFVDKQNIPLLPRPAERGTRPPGTFFDHFTEEDEKLVWESERDDFEMLGYERYNGGLPDGASNCLHVTPDRAAVRRR